VAVADVVGRPTGLNASLVVAVAAAAHDTPPPLPPRPPRPVGGGLDGCHAPGAGAGGAGAGWCRSDPDCSGHGRCVGAGDAGGAGGAGVCVCDGDFIGDACEVDLFLSPRHLPASDALAAPWRCRRAAAAEAATRRAAAQLRAIVRPYPTLPPRRRGPRNARCSC
jgi:hypothetical protein